MNKVATTRASRFYLWKTNIELEVLHALLARRLCLARRLFTSLCSWIGQIICLYFWDICCLVSSSINWFPPWIMFHYLNWLALRIEVDQLIKQSVVKSSIYIHRVTSQIAIEYYQNRVKKQRCSCFRSLRNGESTDLQIGQKLDFFIIGWLYNIFSWTWLLFPFLWKIFMEHDLQLFLDWNEISTTICKSASNF